jgi:hypothetical protein
MAAGAMAAGAMAAGWHRTSHQRLDLGLRRRGQEDLGEMEKSWYLAGRYGHVNKGFLRLARIAISVVIHTLICRRKSTCGRTRQATFTPIPPHRAYFALFSVSWNASLRYFACYPPSPAQASPKGDGQPHPFFRHAFNAVRRW